MIFDFKSIVEQINQSNIYYKSFIDEPHMDMGMLVLKPGEEDDQKSHTKDEVYFIIQGNGYLTLNNQKFPIKEKSFYLVKKNTTHKFSNNTKSIIVVYFFGC
ncbi:MAG: hypothetical protein HeimC3_42430 [Candidatus Heimdallarchaeota archaeon LC_3]|nr:MAG: hypothetical protein HeimC3_42430 [Candidatus Heimdallarchaeota archaeon LC_3]